MTPRVPNHQRWYAKWKPSWNMYVHNFFCTFGVDLYTQSVLIKQFLHRSSVGSLLRVRCWLGMGIIRGGNPFQREHEGQDGVQG